MSLASICRAHISNRLGLAPWGQFAHLLGLANFAGVTADDGAAVDFFVTFMTTRNSSADDNFAGIAADGRDVLMGVEVSDVFDTGEIL